MVFVKSPWDNCNLRWIVHSGLPVSICWVCGVCYSGTRVQKCRVRAPDHPQTSSIFLCAYLVPSLILKLFYARIWKAWGEGPGKNSMWRQKKSKWVSWKMAWGELPNAQNSQQHLRTRASMCHLHALYTWSAAS